MKKKYVKPVFVFESFSLDTNIAGDCEKIVGTPTRGTCTVEGTGGITMFDDSASGICMFEPDGEWNGFCYHVPVDYKNLFNS